MSSNSGSLASDNPRDLNEQTNKQKQVSGSCFLFASSAFSKAVQNHQESHALLDLSLA